jgi:signal transduction histidine kinase
MTLIYTAAQHSLRRERSREELLDGMHKILRESQRTTALIDDLLLLARGDAGRESSELVRIDAAPLLREAAEQATAIAEAKQISVSLRLDADRLPVRANEAQLRRLLLILIDNALKYTPGGGRVTIAAGADATGVTIAVADTGAGISPGDLPHVFERFWRADKVRSREAGGAGLGLTIAKQIAQLQGADLSVQSEVDRGSTFQIRFGNPAP